MSDNKLIDFQIMKINRNAQKICKCDPPSYEIDTKNRLIQCTKCNAYIQPFDALLYMAENMEEYDSKIDEIHEEIKKITEKRNKYAKEVNELSRKKFRMNKFRDIQNSYMKGMMPVCPHCEKPFDPTEIDHCTNKNYCNYKKKKSREEKITDIAFHKVGKGLDRWDEIAKLEEVLKSYTDEELDKEIEKIKKWLGDD